MSLRVTLSALALSTALAALPGLAAADRGVPEVTYEVPTADTQPASLLARVAGGPRVAADRIVLSDDAGHRIHPTSVVRAADSDETWAVMFVVQGGEVYMGNDDLTGDDSDPSRYYGILKSLEGALTALDLPHELARGSQVGITVYDSAAHVVVPLHPATSFEGSELGTQKDYYGKMGTDLVPGVELGLAELQRTSATHKVMFVIGDGNDTNNDAAKSQLADAKKMAATVHVEVHAILYKGPLSELGNVVTSLDGRASTVNSVDSIGAVVRARLRQALDVSRLTFPLAELVTDGKIHTLTLTVDGQELDPELVDMPALSAPCAFSHWWMQLLGGFGAVGLLAALMRFRPKSGH